MSTERFGKRPYPSRIEYGVEERQIEPDVMADDHRIADEFQESRKRFLDSGRLDHHRLGDSGQDGDVGRDR